MSTNPLQFHKTGDLHRLVADHTAGPDGRCVACHSTNTPPPVWPCGLRNLAVRELRARRQAPTGE